MRKLMFLLLALTMIAQIGYGQARRVVLLEEATNASCAPCAANNPGLQAFFEKHFGGVISVRYHAWWPGFDPMYNLNTPDNTARINYYGINGVPNYTIDGDLKGVPSSPGAIKSEMLGRLALESPVRIDVDAQISEDSVTAVITITALADVSQTNLHLRTAIIERMVVYGSPPGNNGETVFPDVMRKLLPSPTGTSIAGIDSGDVLVYNVESPVDGANWNSEDLAVVSWLQSDATKEIVQAGISLPTYIITTSSPTAEFVDVNQSYSMDYTLVNDNPQSLNLQVMVEPEVVPAGWTYSLMYNAAPIDTIVATVNPGDTLHFSLAYDTGPTPDGMKLRIFAQDMDDEYDYGYSAGYFGVVANGNVLFVDDDGAASWQTNYHNIFDAEGVEYTSIEEADAMLLADQISPTQFEAVFWNVSWGFPALNENNVTFLEDYLDAGGNLFIAGQDIGWDIFDAAGSSNFQAAKDFYHDYLDADYISDNSGVYVVEGIPGDPITHGVSFNVAAVYSRYPEWISSFGGGGVEILRYVTTGDRFGGIRYDAGTFRTIYLGVGIEQMSDTQARHDIVRRSLNWFGISTITAIDDGASVPLEFALHQNYPNPFNPTTSIRYVLPESEKVTLKVYNTLGQEVRTLVSGFQQTGQHDATWDGKNRFGKQVGSGVYIYRLEAGKRVKMKKMMLMK